jgi:serine/threonine protein kinase
VQIGKYEIVTKLGSGGMAEIHVARDANRRVAIVKQMLAQFAEQPDYVEMFLDEGRMVSLLRHPNIVEMYDFGFVGEIPYLAMEYLHGVDLRALLRAAKVAALPVPFPVATAIGRAASAALHHAHEARSIDGTALELVHRDVSPQNLIVAFDGRVKLIDFGIAKSRGRLHETRAGSLKGKVPYMAPEQIRAGSTDRRTDIYATGVVLYELITGRRPYIVEQGEEPQGEFSLMMAIVGHKLASATRLRPDLPAALEQIVLRALAAKPTDRFATAGEMAEALAALPCATPPQIAAYLSLLFGQRPSIAHAENDDAATEIHHLEELRTSGNDDYDLFVQAAPEQAALEQVAPARAAPVQGVVRAAFEKRVVGDRTSLRLERPVEPSFRWAKLLDGVEGALELDLGAVLLEPSACMAAAVALRSLGGEARTIEIIGAPLALAHALAGSRATIRSIATLGHCASCAATRLVVLPYAELGGATCPRCGTPLALVELTPPPGTRRDHRALVVAVVLASVGLGVALALRGGV